VMLELIWFMDTSYTCSFTPFPGFNISFEPSKDWDVFGFPKLEASVSTATLSFPKRCQLYRLDVSSLQRSYSIGGCSH
jgi:hypothetical protein